MKIQSPKSYRQDGFVKNWGKAKVDPTRPVKEERIKLYRKRARRKEDMFKEN